MHSYLGNGHSFKLKRAVTGQKKGKENRKSPHEMRCPVPIQNKTIKLEEKTKNKTLISLIGSFSHSYRRWK